ncbi:MAG TPA: glutamine-hydrolyzing carbamoyl-phosphate synthase small subunit [Ktedonobacteraceae bacterium]|jgi:carbamoyl-phosphate synthase small subunit|nr:glutamine-hydrolyzing carbamoyl-phosphate synthase small subunit [Ktedonobacteraceae bacterium]
MATTYNHVTHHNLFIQDQPVPEAPPGERRGKQRRGTLLLEDGTSFEGISFGYDGAAAGEVVFGTGMVGYPEALTDASFRGQILVMTYPIIGNYGVPEQSYWEDDRIHVAGLIVSNYIDTPSHASSTMTLGTWLRQEKIPALEIKDTRRLTQHIRTHGSMLGKIVFDEDIPFYDPNIENLVAQVSVKEVKQEGDGDITIALIDCGMKRNIARSLLARNARVVIVPWDWDLFSPSCGFSFDGIVISNGPGNPKLPQKTIQTIRTALEHEVPMLGICLGHQLLALAAGGDTYKLKFGHRSQNQPCLLQGDKRCYITTQNHSFAVGVLPPGFSPWFVNANDGSNEGMRHSHSPFLSVQFHPEATPGPLDTEWIFDYFLERVQSKTGGAGGR